MIRFTRLLMGLAFAIGGQFKLFVSDTLGVVQKYDNAPKDNLIKIEYNFYRTDMQLPFLFT